MVIDVVVEFDNIIVVVEVADSVVVVVTIVVVELVLWKVIVEIVRLGSWSPLVDMELGMSQVLLELLQYH